jgi:hypothetical protein
MFSKEGTLCALFFYIRWLEFTAKRVSKNYDVSPGGFCKIFIGVHLL